MAKQLLATLFTVCLLVLWAPCTVVAEFADPNFATGVYTLTGLSYFTTYNEIYPGACGQNPPSNETDLVAIPWTNDNFDWAFCGACYKFTNTANKKSAVAKIVDWWDQNIPTVFSYPWYICAYPGRSPYNKICPAGVSCDKIDIELVTCPYTSNIVLLFNQWNNGGTIQVTPLYHLVPIYKCSHHDASTPKGTVNWLTPGGSYQLANYPKVTVPFTLTFYTIVDEAIAITVTGLPGIKGGWPVGATDLGGFVYYPTDNQATIAINGRKIKQKKNKK